jgi:hypothetical protein
VWPSPKVVRPPVVPISRTSSPVATMLWTRAGPEATVRAQFELPSTAISVR